MTTDSQHSSPRLRVLILTKVFPNSVNKQLGPFNRQQFLALTRFCEVNIVALIPWFPGARLFPEKSEAGRMHAVPASESIDGLEIRHPRAFYFPRFVHRFNPMTFALSLLPTVLPFRRKVDVILGSWAFPDGLAAIQLGKWLDLPVVVKVHGSDLNVLSEHPSVRPVLSRRLPRVHRLVAVSRPLGAKARALGVPDDRIAVVPNGVDHSLFKPRDRAEARRELQLPDGRLILFVGRLEETKGVLDLVAAFERIAPLQPDLCLAMVGNVKLAAQCRALQVKWPGRVFVPGPQLLPQVARWVAACDVLSLPSWNEGTPNVVLEALASGRRVVATDVGGIPDVLDDPATGEMVPAHNPEALAAALLRVANSTYDPAAVAVAGPPDWGQSAALLHEVLRSARDGTPLSSELRLKAGR